jgi:hypothetical protein
MIAACMIGLFFVACVKRVPAYDEAGELITEREIAANQTNKNFTFYTLAGGALSFGVSFFAGTLVTRALDKPQNSPELWATVGAGTIVGTTLFATHGKKRDRSQAIEAVREERKERAVQHLTSEKAKQEQVAKQIRDLEELRAKQEAEKAKLAEELKKKKDKKGKNRPF